MYAFVYVYAFVSVYIHIHTYIYIYILERRKFTNARHRGRSWMTTPNFAQLKLENDYGMVRDAKDASGVRK